MGFVPLSSRRAKVSFTIAIFGAVAVSRSSTSRPAIMGIPMIAGRDVEDRDTATAPKIAIVNETFARRLLNGTNPIGKTFRTVAEPGYPEAVYEIVGLVNDTKYNNLREKQQAICFAASLQHPLGGRPSGQIMIRSSVPLAGLLPTLKRAIAEQ